MRKQDEKQTKYVEIFIMPSILEYHKFKDFINKKSNFVIF